MDLVVIFLDRTLLNIHVSSCLVINDFKKLTFFN